MMTGNKTEDECRALVKETIEGISSAVQAEQQTLDALDTGHECADLGQDEIVRLTGKKTEAVAAQQTAHDELAKASGAMVRLEPRSLELLENESCGWIHQDQRLISAKATRDDAKQAHDDRTTKAEAATSELEDAKDQAARLKKECDCRVLTEHEMAWTAASQSTQTNSNRDAWIKAHNMQCVLEHKTECPVRDCPTVHDIKLAVIDTKLLDCPFTTEERRLLALRLQEPTDLPTVPLTKPPIKPKITALTKPPTMSPFRLQPLPAPVAGMPNCCTAPDENTKDNTICNGVCYNMVCNGVCNPVQTG